MNSKLVPEGTKQLKQGQRDSQRGGEDFDDPEALEDLDITPPSGAEMLVEGDIIKDQVAFDIAKAFA